MYSKKVEHTRDVSARDLTKFNTSNVDDLPIEAREVSIKRTNDSHKSLVRDPGSLRIINTDESPKI